MKLFEQYKGLKRENYILFFGKIVTNLGAMIWQMKAVGFGANIKPIAVKDIKGYNHATGILLIAYGLIFVVLGLPLLS